MWAYVGAIRRSVTGPLVVGLAEESLTDGLNMTIAVDWKVRPQTKLGVQCL